MLSKRTAVIAIIVLIGGAFLAGYLPQQRFRTAAEQESLALRKGLEAAEARVRLGRLLGQVLAIEEVVVRQNYGQAQKLSSTFFDEVRAEAAATPRDEFRSVLQDVLSQRDSVTASLTRADSGVRDVLQTIEVQIRRVLDYPLPQDLAAKVIPLELPAPSRHTK
jgi:hypothetical protein